MVRLVKGAYWDSEIKRAQVDGLDGYPVYTRKVYTDVSYLACARKLLAAPGAGLPAVRHPQRPHAGRHPHAGRPELLRRAVRVPVPARHGRAAVRAGGRRRRRGKLGRPCRIYAPVGTHETLLAYLVRRLLENGANTSFVNRIADESLSARRAGAGPGAGGAADGRARRRGRPAAPGASRCRATCTAPRARTRAASTSPTSLRPGRADAEPGRRRGTALAGRADAGRRPAAAARTAPVGNPADWRRHRRPGARGRRRGDRGRTALRRRPPRPPGPAAAPAERAGVPGARRRPAGSPHRPADGPADARGRQDRRQRRRRGARGGRLPALLRAAGAARFRQRHAPAAGPGRSASARGTSRWRSSPARSRRRWPPATRCSPSRPSRRR